MPHTRSRYGPRWARCVLPALVVLGTVGLLTASSVGASPTPPAPNPAKEVTFGIGPSNAKGVDGRSDLNYSVSPGATTSDHVELFNYSNKALVLNVYTVDGFDNASGAISFDPKAAPGNDAHSWISVALPGGAPTVTMPPRSRLVLPMQIRVPSSASPGDHLAAVITSVIAKANIRGRANVNFEQRVALRAFFHVSGTLLPQLAVIGLTAKYHDNWNPFGAGSVTVTYRVKNTGNVVLGGKEKVTITGLFGSTGSMHAVADVPPLLVGGSFPVRVEVHNVWPEVLMHAGVTVAPESVVGSVNPPLHIAHGQTSFFAIPWALIILVVLILGLGYGLRRWLRKARSGAPARHRPVDRKRTELVGKAAS